MNFHRSEIRENGSDVLPPRSPPLRKSVWCGFACGAKREAGARATPNIRWASGRTAKYVTTQCTVTLLAMPDVQRTVIYTLCTACAMGWPIPGIWPRARATVFRARATARWLEVMTFLGGSLYSS